MFFHATITWNKKEASLEEYNSEYYSEDTRALSRHDGYDKVATGKAKSDTNMRLGST